MTNAMMWVSVCVEPGRVELQQRPVPIPGENEILVKVAVCGICGTDVAVWQGSMPKSYPHCPGHEFCGTVTARGAGAGRFDIGCRVVINPNLGCGTCDYCRAQQPNLCDALKTRRIKSNGGLANYVALDARMAHALPDELPDVLAPFVEPLSCALHAARAAEAGHPRRVAIFGAGPMGILTALVLKRRMPEIVVVDPAECRREQVRALLDVSVLTPEQLEHADADNAPDAAVDCSGRLNAISLAVKCLRKGGQLVLAGLVAQTSELPFPFGAVTTKELTVCGVWLNPNTFAEAIGLAVEHRDVLSRLTTAVFSLHQIAEAFQYAARQEVLKVLVRP